MTDQEILDLYWKRDENAITETAYAHGTKLSCLAMRILNNDMDVEEAVNDTYLKAWNTIPPQRPQYFFAYLAKICRFQAFEKLDWYHAKKRSAEIVVLTSELEQCIPDRSQEEEIEEKEIGKLINQFLVEQSKENRLIFMRRYWYADSVKEIASRYGISESKVKTALHRTRNRLKLYLQKEGVEI